MKREFKAPPKIARTLLKWLTWEDERAAILGDFEEIYNEIYLKKGRLRAVYWYWTQTGKSLPLFLKYYIYWSIDMFKNYFIIAFRNMKRHQIYSIINISGFAIGLTIFMLAALYADFQNSWDTIHDYSERTYTVIKVFSAGNTNEQHTGVTQASLSSLLKTEFPEIEDAVFMAPERRRIVRYGNKKFFEENPWYVTSNFFSFFSFKLIRGTREQVFTNNYSVVLTESTARKYFGDEDPVGKVITIDPDLNLIVSGIAEDVPLNSSIKFDMLFSINLLKGNSIRDSYGINFIRLGEKADIKGLHRKAPLFIEKYLGAEKNLKEIYFFPMEKLSLDSNHIAGNWWHNSRIDIFLFLGFGVIVLLLMCFNFMNLATARYSTRVREIGMRKVSGARRSQLIIQFVGESVLIAVIAFPLALLLFQIILPSFNHLVSFVFKYDISFRHNPLLLVKLFGFTVLTGVFSGIYPAFFLSRLKPVQILKGNHLKGKGGGKIRKILVTLQFAFSVVLIVSAVLTVKQYRFLYQFDLGYNRDRVMVVTIDRSDPTNNIPTLKDELLKHSDISSVSSAVHIPKDWYPQVSVIPEGFDANKPWFMKYYGIDYDFIETLDIKVLKGRSFSQKNTDVGNYIINETAARQLQWQDPIGKRLTINNNNTGVVIGVVKDFYFRHIHFGSYPAIFYIEPKDLNFLYIKFSNDPDNKMVGYIKEQWQKFNPNHPFDYSMLDKYFDLQYDGIRKFGHAFGFLSLITVLYACLGVLGICFYSIQRRVKEIGIRKVLGANMHSIMSLLIWDFLKLVILANLAVCPVIYFIIKPLLKSAFTHTPGVGIGVFLLAGFFTMAAALITVFSQTYKAATSNPLEVLRGE